LDGHYGKTACSDSGINDFSEGWECGRCNVCYACGYVHDVGRAELGGETQALIYNPKTGKVIALMPSALPYRSDGQFLQRKRNELPS